MGDWFLFKIFKAFVVLGAIGVVFGFFCLLIIFFVDKEEVRENLGKYSTSMGNALFIMHSIFEPSRRPQTEQVIWVKKRRTPVEKKFSGLSELHYDKICVKGFKSTKNKRFYVKSGI